MSADLLRRAATLMRERAEAATFTRSPWGVDEVGAVWAQEADGQHVPISRQSTDRDAEHIASWHPAVALAVAKAMDDVAQAWEISDGWARDLDDDPIRFEDTVDGGWLKVARAYLGEAS